MIRLVVALFIVVGVSNFAPPALAADTPVTVAQTDQKAAKQGRRGGETMVNHSCGCNAKCEANFTPSAVTSCVEDGVCKSDKKEDGCTLTCKKGKEEKKVEGKCVKVYN